MDNCQLVDLNRLLHMWSSGEVLHPGRVKQEREAPTLPQLRQFRFDAKQGPMYGTAAVATAALTLLSSSWRLSWSTKHEGGRADHAWSLAHRRAHSCLNLTQFHSETRCAGNTRSNFSAFLLWKALSHHLSRDLRPHRGTWVLHLLPEIACRQRSTPTWASAAHSSLSTHTWHSLPQNAGQSGHVK